MRIQNFGSWSPFLVKEGRNVLGLEYTVREGDGSWTAAGRGADRGGPRRSSPTSASSPPRCRGRLRRAPARRPTRSTTTATRPTSTSFVAGSAAHAANVHPVGRNGMFRYNNQDHSMYTAMLTVENIVSGHDARRLVGQRRGGLPRGASDERRPARDRQGRSSAAPSGVGCAGLVAAPTRSGTCAAPGATSRFGRSRSGWLPAGEWWPRRRNCCRCRALG